jgi:hypothetical protein
LFNFTLQYFKILQSCEPLYAKMNSTSCLFTWSPVFQLAGAFLYDEIIRQKCCSILVWIAGYEPESKEQLKHFWSTVRRKRSGFEHMQTMIKKSRRLDSFLHEAAQNFELLSNSS